MQDVIKNATIALNSSFINASGVNCSLSLSNLLEICRVCFLCAGRMTENSQEPLKHRFISLTVRLAESLRSLSYPETGLETKDVFRLQCALDMAMRCHKNVPGIVDESLLRALHESSVKMFTLEVNADSYSWRGEVLPTKETSILAPDWEEILTKKREYVGVEIHRHFWDYSGEWDEKSLRTSCKSRIEFLLRYTFWQFDDLLFILEDYDF